MTYPFCRLYNKEAVLMALLDKSNMPEVARHIRSMKDVTVLQLTVNPSYKQSSKADTYNDTQTAQHSCPVTGLEMSGRYRYIHCHVCSGISDCDTLRAEGILISEVS